VVNLHGLRHRVVALLRVRTGFVQLERRWPVEGSVGWLGHSGGLHRERVSRPDVATGRLASVASPMSTSALNDPV
jgi:hypothetical protein